MAITIIQKNEYFFSLNIYYNTIFRSKKNNILVFQCIIFPFSYGLLVRNPRRTKRLKLCFWTDESKMIFSKTKDLKLSSVLQQMLRIIKPQGKLGISLSRSTVNCLGRILSTLLVISLAVSGNPSQLSKILFQFQPSFLITSDDRVDQIAQRIQLQCACQSGCLFALVSGAWLS